MLVVGVEEGGREEGKVARKLNSFRRSFWNNLFSQAANLGI